MRTEGDAFFKIYPDDNVSGPRTEASGLIL